MYVFERMFHDTKRRHSLCKSNKKQILSSCKFKMGWNRRAYSVLALHIWKQERGKHWNRVVSRSAASIWPLNGVRLSSVKFTAYHDVYRRGSTLKPVSQRKLELSHQYRGSWRRRRRSAARARLAEWAQMLQSQSTSHQTTGLQWYDCDCSIYEDFYSETRWKVGQMIQDLFHSVPVAAV
jgi:hypothetical protein